MAGLTVAPFADEHLEGAALLLADRHARHRVAEPLLSDRYSHADQALEVLGRTWRIPCASGAVAARSGRLVGYLIGAPRDNPVWGANIWIESGGHAVEAAEDVRDLYAAAAARWVDESRTRHYVLVPATDVALVEAWFRLSFGQQQAHSVREAAETDVHVPEGFTIGEPGVEDIDALVDVDLALPQHQRSSPVFSAVELSTREESRQEWLSTLEAGEEKLLVAFQGERPVACWAVVPVERSREHRDLLRPDNACFLGFAATLPDFRGAGVGIALTDAALAWAAEQGYETMVTDWRVTNLLASRFWPARGFRETFLRLYRSIP